MISNTMETIRDKETIEQHKCLYKFLINKGDFKFFSLALLAIKRYSTIIKQTKV